MDPIRRESVEFAYLLMRFTITGNIRFGAEIVFQLRESSSFDGCMMMISDQLSTENILRTFKVIYALLKTVPKYWATRSKITNPVGWMKLKCEIP